MSATTSRLLLYKPGGGLSGLILPDEIVDIDRINSNMDILDANIGFRNVTSGTRPLSPYDGEPIYETDTTRVRIWNNAASQWLAPGAERGSATDYTVADLNAIAGITDSLPGDVLSVRAAVGWFFQRNAGGTAWVQVGAPQFASASTRDTEYAKASGAYLVTGAQIIRTDMMNATQTYNATGTAWRYDQGLVPIKPTGISGTGWTIGPNGQIIATAATGNLVVSGAFSADFDNYFIDIDLTSVAVANFTMQLAVGGTPDATASAYDTARSGNVGGANIADATPGGTSWPIGTGAAASYTSHTGGVELRAPFKVARTRAFVDFFQNIATMTAAGSAIGQRGNEHRSSASFDGFGFTFSGTTPTITGTVRVYGKNNN